MSRFAAFFLGAPSQEALIPARQKARVGRNQPQSLDSQLTRGEQVYHFLEASYGEDYAWEYAMVKYPRRKGPVSERSETREDDLPRGFWKDYVQDVLRLEYSNAQKMRASRALHVYLDRMGSQPKMTRIALRGERKGTSCRSSGGAYNALKGAGGLWHALLQWFVDEIASIKLRADSSMLLEKAREMRDFLIDAHGYSADQLPKLEPSNTGYKWVKRWRLFHNISKRHHWNRLKVSWLKLKKRIRTNLTNIFRLTTTIFHH